MLKERVKNLLRVRTEVSEKYNQELIYIGNLFKANEESLDRYTKSSSIFVYYRRIFHVLRLEVSGFDER